MVRNAGARAGHEVVEMYARAIRSNVPMPLRQLWAFERVWLDAGAERPLVFRLRPADAVAHYDVVSQAFAVEPGDYEIEAGASSRDIRLAGRFRVR